MLRLYFGLFILALVLAVPVALVVAYVVWMVKTRKRGRKRLFWGQTVAAVMAVAALVFLLDLTPASHWYFERQRTLAWTGMAFSFGKTLYQYDTGRSFNGDGYSVKIVALPPEAARYFSAPPPVFFAEYPAIPGFQGGASGLQLVRWRNGPVRGDEERFVRFALYESWGEPQPDIRNKDLSKAVRHALSKSTSLYAYYWRYPGPQVNDIYFFLIDPEEQRLYILNNNT